MTTHAAITGWGKCLPPAVLSNQDLATFLDTDDEWITSRTGMKERRVSHVPLGELAHVAAARAREVAVTVTLAGGELQAVARAAPGRPPQREARSSRAAPPRSGP